jgi:hypothetical protein
LWGPVYLDTKDIVRPVSPPDVVCSLVHDYQGFTQGYVRDMGMCED